MSAPVPIHEPGFFPRDRHGPEQPKRGRAGARQEDRVVADADVSAASFPSR